VLPDQDLLDTDGPGFVALNGGFQAENRSLIGQLRSLSGPKCAP
jgi:hypothetical protein